MGGYSVILQSETPGAPCFSAAPKGRRLSRMKSTTPLHFYHVSWDPESESGLVGWLIPGALGGYGNLPLSFFFFSFLAHDHLSFLFFELSLRHG
jgi:hypothetical protein